MRSVAPHRRNPLPALPTLTAAVLLALTTSSCGQATSSSTVGSAPTATYDASPSPSAEPSFDPPELDGRIVFTRAGGQYGDETIFLANADGTDERQLTPPDQSCCVRISPDGTHVLYSALAPDGVRITTAIQDLRDGTVRLIPLPDATANLGPGAWSPDGKRLALQLWDESDPARDGVYTVLADGGGDLQRISDPAVGDIPGDYSPDGSQIVIFREGAELGVGELFIVDTDAGGEPVRISPEGMEVGYGSVRFSPDGTRILFQDSRTAPRGALWTMTPDGSDVTMIFEDNEGRFASHATWSPDGSMIMFALNPVADEFEHRPNGLYVMNADGSDVQLVIGGNDFKREPEWRIP
jgi:Tol biopolymer transport system component